MKMHSLQSPKLSFDDAEGIFGVLRTNDVCSLRNGHLSALRRLTTKIRRVQTKRDRANMNSSTFTNGFHGFLASLINAVNNFVPSRCLGSISVPMHECKQSKSNGRQI